MNAGEDIFYSSFAPVGALQQLTVRVGIEPHLTVRVGTEPHLTVDSVRVEGYESSFPQISEDVLHIQCSDEVCLINIYRISAIFTNLVRRKISPIECCQGDDALYRLERRQSISPRDRWEGQF